MYATKIYTVATVSSDRLVGVIYIVWNMTDTIVYSSILFLDPTSDEIIVYMFYSDMCD